MPLAVDKEEKRGLATPRMTVQNVEVMQYKCTKDPVGFDDQYYDENEKKYEYEYKWMLSTITSIKGIPYMSDWFIDEELNWNKYNVLRSEMKNEDSYVTLNNDRYEMYWTILKYSHKYEENRKLDVKFVPVYILKEDRYQQYQHCEEWECHLEGGVLKSRAATGTAEGDKVICRLDAIKKEGEVVWQRDGQGLAPVQERTKFVNI
jgi:hypothetical protein